MTTALQIKHDTVGGRKTTDTQLLVLCMGGAFPTVLLFTILLRNLTLESKLKNTTP